MVVTLLLEFFINKRVHGSKALDTANRMEQKLNRVNKITLLLRVLEPRLSVLVACAPTASRVGCLENGGCADVFVAKSAPSCHPEQLL